MATKRYPVMHFDIETKANKEALAFLDEPAAPKNLKDPDKIAAAIEEKKIEQVEMAPLDGDLCEIAAIGYAVGDGDIVTMVVNNKKKKGWTEIDMLKKFWTEFAIAEGRVAGYNILAFDLPIILKRSFALGLRPSLIPNLVKYRVGPIYDLQMLLCNWDYRNAHKFKWICKRYGIELPAGYETNGSQVAEMTDKQIADYVYSDVYGVRELFKRMEGFYFI